MIKKIIKRLLGIKQKESEPAYKQYMTEGEGNVFRYGFDVRLDNPVNGKTHLKIGNKNVLYCNIVLESNKSFVEIGDECLIAGCMIMCSQQVIIEDHAYISWGTTICDHSTHSLDYRERRNDLRQIQIDIQNRVNLNINKNWDTVDSKPIRICSDAWIGMNCMVMKGVTIGKGAIVGANSVVTKDVAPFTVVAGNPAKVVKTLPPEITY